MPGEIRLVIFNDAEVLTALTEYRKRRSQPLPSSEDVEVTVRDKSKILVTLAIVPKGKKMPIEFVFEGEELAAALIMYCIRRKIPLPATGVSKSIQLVGGSITLQILKDVSKEQMAAMSDLF
ncbi:MAG: hypothetical protein V3S74_07935 [Alphaproteobacteria bacterium]